MCAAGMTARMSSVHRVCVLRGKMSTIRERPYRLVDPRGSFRLLFWNSPCPGGASGDAAVGTDLSTGGTLLSSSTVARPHGARRILRAATAGLVALAVALSGPVATAQETEPPVVETTTPTETPAETPGETPVETPTGTPSETPVETPTETPSETPGETPSETPGETPTETGTPDPEPSEEDTPAPDRQDVAPAAEQPSTMAAPPAQRPDLAVTVAFDRDEYLPDTDIGATITVRNKGTAPAHDVRLQVNTNVKFGATGVELTRVPGPTLAPGESRTHVVKGRLSWSGETRATLSVTAVMGPQQAPYTDLNPDDNRAEDTAAVPQQHGQAGGVLYRDANGNGQFDEGEGVAGTSVSANGGAPFSTPYTTTDATGRFSFGTLPTGTYRVSAYTYPSDEVVAGPAANFTVSAGATTELRLPLVPPVYKVLRSTVEFDRDSYRPGDRAGIRITLDNTGQAPLTGVVAVCDLGWGDGATRLTDPAWAPLDPDGPGITLGEETRVFTMSEPIPAEAVEAGRINVLCHFGNGGRNTNGTAGSSDSADIGVFGAVEGTLALDSGDGEPVPLDGVRVVAVDQRTRLTGASTTTRDGGRFTFPELAAGSTRLLVLGPYRDRDTGNGWFTVDVVADGTANVALVVVAGPEVREPVNVDNLVLEASFDKTSYDVGDPVRATIKITNEGVGWGTELDFLPEWHESTLGYDLAQWGDLYPFATGHYPFPTSPSRLRLWPGQTHVVELTGTAPQWSREGKVRLKGTIRGGYSNQQLTLDLVADVTHQTGDAVVVVFGDTNGNGTPDAGEELPDLQVGIEGGLPATWRSGTTDATGRFRVEDVPAGQYRVTTWVDDWVPAFDDYDVFVVTGGAETVHEAPLVRPLGDALVAGLAFDRPSYQPTDQPKLTVSLTNNTGADLTVHAQCGSTAWPYQVDNGPEWGPLAEGGPGVPLAAGATWTYTVNVVVPEDAADYGLVGAACDFGPRESDGRLWAGSVRAEAKARVPGATWTTTGRVEVYGESPQRVVPNVKLVLLDPDTGAPVARTTTGEDGSFVFPDLPVGEYTPVVVGPWKVVWYEMVPGFHVIRDNPYPVVLFVEPGPEVADPDLTTTDPDQAAGPGRDDRSGGVLGAPASAGGPTDALASTGASVIGIALLGLLALALGVATRVSGRRRTA